jgi:hypothetical protein
LRERNNDAGIQLVSNTIHSNVKVHGICYCACPEAVGVVIMQEISQHAHPPLDLSFVAVGRYAEAQYRFVEVQYSVR